MSIIIRNARIIDPDNHTDAIGSIFIRDGVFTPPFAPDDETQIIDGTGLCAVPGLVDLHVHLRDPGQTYKEDILTGCQSAASGGVTSLLAMPNTRPTVDTPETVQYILDKAKNAAAHVYVVGAITCGLKSEVPTDIEALRKAGISALSDDGRPVENTRFMVDAMKKAKELHIPVTAHCEDPYLAGGKVNEGKLSALLGVRGMPAAAEDAGTAREIALAAAYDLPIHICHVSTATSAAMICDAKKRGVQVTAETAPHYIMLTEEELVKRDADYRMNPPLRTEKDRLAMIEALCDGTIDAIATDHAPHSVEEKADFVNAPNGAIGMETSFAAAYTVLVKSGRMTLAQLIDKMSCTPAKILHIPAGTLSVGQPADVMLFDPDEEWTVDPDKLHGKSKNTPFKGLTLTAKVKYTVCGGKIVFKGE